MKHIITILLTLLVAISAIGQQNLNTTTDNKTKNIANIVKHALQKQLSAVALVQSPLIKKQAMDSVTIEYNWEDVWENEESTLYLWDDKGMEHLNYLCEYTWENVSIPYQKIEYSYLEDFVLGEMTIMESALDRDDWVNSHKVEFSYPKPDSIIALLSFWETNNYYPELKMSYLLDENNNFLKVTTSYYYGNNLWELEEITEYTYDDGKLGTVVYSWKDPDSQTWYLDEKLVYEYGSNGELSAILVQTWTEDLNNWEDDSKLVNSYDEQLNLTEQIIWSWDVDNEDWAESEKYVYTYNNNYEYYQLLLPYHYNGAIYESYSGFSFRHLPEQEINYDYYDGEWLEFSRTTYYFSETDYLNITELGSDEILLYPNPAANYLQFDLANVTKTGVFRAFDLSGSEVVSQQFDTQGKVDISHLKPGVYLYILSVDDRLLKGKFVKAG